MILMYVYIDISVIIVHNVCILGQYRNKSAILEETTLQRLNP